ncbi:MAG: NAD/NADP octopine/nopaline dehydrogenase family protein [candidate division NC10 bacterium]|nr:NAD/NADP octopine/nopaline dehydrogenase family protein [candidate division NC10 bacterium]
MGKHVAVIGAGNGGTAIAGDLTLAGHECRLFEFTEWAGNVDAVNAQGGIKVTGVARTGFAKVALATTDLKAALDAAELVMVATQAVTHTRVAQATAPLVRPGQVMILWPGSGGTLEFRRIFDELGVKTDVILGEAATLPYCCRRLEGPGTVNIHRIDGPRNQVAALPASRTPELMAALTGVYDTVVPAQSVLEPALYNPNIIVHPAGALFNMGRIEHSQGEFWMYKEGITPSVKKIINGMDRERQAIMAALGYTPMTYEQVFTDLFNVSVAEFAVASSQGPFSMQDRYVTEDVPMGVTLTASLGRTLGVPTPTYDAIIHIASLVNETEYYTIGRNLANLSLDGLSSEQLNAYVMTGRRPRAARASAMRRVAGKRKAARTTRHSRAAGARSRATKRGRK